MSYTSWGIIHCFGHFHFGHFGLGHFGFGHFDFEPFDFGHFDFRHFSFQTILVSDILIPDILIPDILVFGRFVLIFLGVENGARSNFERLLLMSSQTSLCHQNLFGVSTMCAKLHTYGLERVQLVKFLTGLFISIPF
jgi:hypothetical protein